MKITNQTSSEYYDNYEIAASALGTSFNLIKFDVTAVDLVYVANMNSGKNLELVDFKIKFSRMKYSDMSTLGSTSTLVTWTVVGCASCLFFCLALVCLQKLWSH